MGSRNRIEYRCKKLNFQKAFRVVANNDSGAYPLPDIDFQDVSDCYSYYVGIMGVSEDVFWHCDIGFVRTVAINKQAFEKWHHHQIKLRDKNHGKKRSKGKI